MIRVLPLVMSTAAVAPISYKLQNINLAERWLGLVRAGVSATTEHGEAYGVAVGVRALLLEGGAQFVEALKLGHVIGFCWSGRGVRQRRWGGAVAFGECGGRSCAGVRSLPEHGAGSSPEHGAGRGLTA